MMIDHGLDRYVDWKSKIPTYFSGDEIYNNRRVQPPTVPAENVLILAKRNKLDLRHLNKFLMVKLEKLYTWDEPEGWMIR